jgi:peptide/nickel transport system substrate-binding protein
MSEPDHPDLDSSEEPSDFEDTTVDRRTFLAIGAGAAAGVLLGGRAAAAATPTKPNKGGTLRVAVQGGGQAETLNPLTSSLDSASTLRSFQLFDWLVSVGPKLQSNLALAESIDPTPDGLTWTIRLRPGIQWHDGKPLTADDLLYTLNFLADPANASTNRAITTNMNLAAVKKLDKLTVRIPMTAPVGDLISLISVNSLAVIQNGTTDFSNPIGTGPFMFKSFSAGQNSVFVRNPNYWKNGLPFVDELDVYSIPDNNARLYALTSGQVDAMATIPLPQAKAFLAQGNNSPIAILIGKGPNQASFTMGTAHPPFNDGRVRAAMRLIVDRQQMLDQVFLGLGQVANDLYAKGFPYYDNALPQRAQDIEQAMSLLKAAGQAGMTVTLSTTDGTGGKLASATLLAEQAKAAGVTINLLQLPSATYFSSVFPNYAFAQVNWQPTPLPTNYFQKVLPTSPFNACQWNDATTTKLVQTALATVDKTKAQELWTTVQKIFYARGAEIIFATSPTVDGVSWKLGGVTASYAGVLNYYNFNRWYFK